MLVFKLMFLEILLLLIVCLNVLLGIFVLTQNPKSTSNRLFSLLGLMAAVWTFTNYMTGISTDVFWFDGSYAFGSLVIAVGLIWTLVITDKKLYYKKIIPICILAILFFICSYIPGFMTQSYNQDYLGVVAINTPGKGVTLYLVYYLVTSYLILRKLFYSQKASIDTNEKVQLKLIFQGALIALLASFISSAFPLCFHMSIWGIDAIGFLIFLFFIAYSITKHRLFNIKMIALELVIFGLWIFILIRILYMEDMRGLLLEGALLLTTIVFGILLIRSTLHGIRQSEQIEKLALKLGENNALMEKMNGVLGQDLPE